MRKRDMGKYAMGYIKAVTAKGGDHYEEFEEYDNEFCEWCFDKWMEEQPRVDGTLYRGYQMTLKQFNALEYKVGSIITQDDIYWKSYPSFTRSEMRAVNYIRDYLIDNDETPAKVLFVVECKGKYGVDIQKHSYYPVEEEHKFVKEAKFEVVDIDNGYFKKVILKEV